MLRCDWDVTVRLCVHQSVFSQPKTPGALLKMLSCERLRVQRLFFSLRCWKRPNAQCEKDTQHLVFKKTWRSHLEQSKKYVSLGKKTLWWTRGLNASHFIKYHINQFMSCSHEPNFLSNSLTSNFNRDDVALKLSWYPLVTLWGKVSPGNLPNAQSVIPIMLPQQEKKMTLSNSCQTIWHCWLPKDPALAWVGHAMSCPLGQRPQGPMVRERLLQENKGGGAEGIKGR